MTDKLHLNNSALRFLVQRESDVPGYLQIWLRKHALRYAALDTGVIQELAVPTEGERFAASCQDTVFAVVAPSTGLEESWKTQRADDTDGTYVACVKGLRKLSKTTYTQLSEGAMAFFGEPQDLTNVLTEDWTTDFLDMTGHYGDRQSIHEYETLLATDIMTDRRGTIAFIEHDNAQAIREAIGPGKHKVLRVTGLDNKPGQPKYERYEATAAEIAKGNCVFPYVGKFRIWVSRTGNVVTKKYIGLAVVKPLSSIVKTPKVKSFATSLALAATGQLEALLSIDETERIKLLLKRSSTGEYWNGIEDLLGRWAGYLTREDFVSYYRDRMGTVSTDIIDEVMLESDLASTTEGRMMRKIQTALNSQETKSQGAQQAKINGERSLNLNERRVVDGRDHLEYLKQEIVRQKQVIIDTEAELEKLRANLAPLQTTAVNEARKLQKMYRAASPKLEALNNRRQMLLALAKENPTDWVKSFANGNMLLVDAWYVNMANGSQISLRNHGFQPGPEWRLFKVHALTLNPVEIKIDARTVGLDHCERRVGGPYEVQCSFNPQTKGRITWQFRLADTHGVFGIDPATANDSYVQASIHPHQQPNSVPRNQDGIYHLATNWASACLGEAEGQLQEAFSRNDLESILWTLLNWFSNCDPQDQWGRKYIWFPRPQDVFMKGRAKAKAALAKRQKATGKDTQWYRKDDEFWKIVWNGDTFKYACQHGTITDGPDGPLVKEMNTGATGTIYIPEDLKKEVDALIAAKTNDGYIKCNAIPRTTGAPTGDSANKYKLKLTDVTKKKGVTCDALRQHFGMTLVAAKRYVDNVPCTTTEILTSPASIVALKAQLDALGVGYKFIRVVSARAPKAKKGRIDEFTDMWNRMSGTDSL